MLQYAERLKALAAQLAEVENRLEAIAKTDDRIRRVQTIPGVGRKTAEAIVAIWLETEFEGGRHQRRLQP